MKRAVVAFLSDEQRAVTRRVVNLSAQLGPCGARLCNAFIFDISTEGFKARVQGEVVIDERAWVQLPGWTPMACKAVWARDDDVGFSFLEPLSVVTLNRVRHASPRSWPKGHFGPQAA